MREFVGYLTNQPHLIDAVGQVALGVAADRGVGSTRGNIFGEVVLSSLVSTNHLASNIVP